MGALTENRKRCFIDLCVPPSHLHPIPEDHAITPPSSKKLKSQLLPPVSNRKIALFPPATPLSRPIHGPQRILRAFNLSSKREGSLLRRDFFGMGNFASRIFKPREDERLRLDDYRSLVEHSDFNRTDLGLGFVREESPASDERELKVLNRKVEARKAVEEFAEAREKVWMTRSPVYKQLHEEARKRDPTLSSLAFQLRLTEEKYSAIQFVPTVQEKKLKEDLHELFRPLTDDEEDEVLHALRGGSRREVLVTHDASNIEITREVMQCLRPGAWLNDEVINLYLELLKERERREPKRFLKCHFFSTFFYKKLISGRSCYDFNAVRRWTTKRKLGYSLIECDKIFVPVHKDIHWCLAVINVKDETLQYLDSLGGMDTNVLRALARYFMDEVKDKSNKQIDTTSWKQEAVDNLPLQQNGSDCGMFMLKYTDFFSRGLELGFSQEHMNYFRKRTIKEILRLKAE